MSAVMLVGADAPLLEGLAQTLAAAGRTTRIAHSVDDALDLAADARPLVAVVDRALAARDTRALHLPLAPGGALVLFSSDAAPLAGDTGPQLFGRVVLADLSLPLERHRLVALIAKVASRVAATGRGRRDTPTEPRA
jgi:DNA-binding NtrC family response regulator